MSGGALGLEAPVVEAESGKLSLIHRESEKAYSRKPIFRIMNPYPIGPTGSSFPRCAPVLWAMHLATRLDGYSASGVRGWRLTSAKPRLAKGISLLPRKSDTRLTTNPSERGPVPSQHTLRGTSLKRCALTRSRGRPKSVTPGRCAES